MGEPQHGIHFLYDFYAFLGIERTATTDVITARWRELYQQYAPDKYQTLAPEFQSQATRKAAHLNRIRAILDDPEKKSAYDEQLTNWTGVVAGSELVPLTLDQFLQNNPDSYGELKEKYAAAAGFNPTIHALLEAQWQATDEPSAQLTAAYRASLEQHETYLALMEGLELDRLGISLTGNSLARLNRPALLEKHCEMRRFELEQLFDAEQKALAGGQLKALGPGASVDAEKLFESDAPTGLARYQQEQLAQFDHQTKELYCIAEQRKDLLDERLTLVPATYEPNLTAYHPRLMIHLDYRGHERSFPVVVDTTAEGYRPRVVEETLEEAFNTLTCKCVEELDLLDLLTELVSRHVGNLPTLDATSDVEEVA